MCPNHPKMLPKPPFNAHVMKQKVLSVTLKRKNGPGAQRISPIQKNGEMHPNEKYTRVKTPSPKDQGAPCQQTGDRLGTLKIEHKKVKQKLTKLQR